MDRRGVEGMYAAAEMRGGREMLERRKKVQRRGRKMVPFWRRILNLCEKGEDKTAETLLEKYVPTLNWQN